MKKLTFSVVLIIFITLSGFSVAQEIAQESLVGYWPFDEGIGKEVNDLSGNGNDGEFVESPKWVSGKYETALEFDGKGSYVLVPDNDSLDLTDAATYMVWFSLNEVPSSRKMRMMSKNDSVFVIFDFGSPDSLDFLVKPNNDFAESTTVDWNLGEWYHFAGTYGGDTLRIYINGKLEGETEGVPEIAPSDLELWIGADDWNPNFFPGAIDEVRIYNKALTEVEINQALEGPAAVQLEDKLAVTWGMIKKK